MVLFQKYSRESTTGHSYFPDNSNSVFKPMRSQWRGSSPPYSPIYPTISPAQPPPPILCPGQSWPCPPFWDPRPSASMLQWEAGQETCLLSRDDANLKGVADVDARPGDHPTSSPWLPHHLQAIASFMGAMLKAPPIMVVGYGRVSWSTPWNHPLVQGRPRHNSTSSNLRSWMMIITYQSLTNQYHPIAHSSQPNGLFQQGNSQKECRPFNWCLIILSSKRKAANIVQPL